MRPRLLEAGHTVTLFDKSTAFGGTVESVIPPDRQRSALKNEITAMFADVPKDRMILNLGRELDSSHNLDTILAQGFDAAFIGLGLPESTSITEKRIDGLWNAMDFLSAAKRGDRVEPRPANPSPSSAAATPRWMSPSRRQQLGARDVYVIYRRSFKEMPAWSAERTRAMTEGVHFLILTQPLEYSRRKAS